MPRVSNGIMVPRNTVAQSLLMRKGGVHEKSATAKRQQVRYALANELDDWREALEFERSLRSDEEKAD